MYTDNFQILSSFKSKFWFWSQSSPFIRPYTGPRYTYLFTYFINIEFPKKHTQGNGLKIMLKSCYAEVLWNFKHLKVHTDIFEHGKCLSPQVELYILEKYTNDLQQLNQLKIG